MSPARVTYAYAAPECGYPTRSCRVCGARPCVVRLGWCAGWAESRRCGSAHFCAEHTAEANRVCRALKAGEIPPTRPAPPWAAGRARARSGGALLERAAGLVDGRPRSA